MRVKMENGRILIFINWDLHTINKKSFRTQYLSLTKLLTVKILLRKTAFTI